MGMAEDYDEIIGDHTASVWEDGFSWGKYKEKEVKDNKYPRKYYRCAHPNCGVKKKVERCEDSGNIEWILYNGAHNHPKPAVGSHFDNPAAAAAAADSMIIHDDRNLQLISEYASTLHTQNGTTPMETPKI